MAKAEQPRRTSDFQGVQRAKRKDRGGSENAGSAPREAKGRGAFTPAGGKDVSAILRELRMGRREK